MFAGNMLLKDKKDTPSIFTVQFSPTWVKVGEGTYPLGQMNAALLNYPVEDFGTLQRQTETLMNIIHQHYKDPSVYPLSELVAIIQNLYNSILDIAEGLPGYERMDLDIVEHRKIFVSIFMKSPEEFSKFFQPGSQQNEWLGIALRPYLSMGLELVAYVKYLTVIIDYFFEKCIKRHPQAYAAAMYDFFTNEEVHKEIFEAGAGLPFFNFQQRRPAMMEYVTMNDPENPRRYMVAERMEFETLIDFLHVDFFRGLIAGNAPRRCHNCGTYFLLTKGYNTVYCNNIAPRETEKTCRKVGAHRKERVKANLSPISAEYKRVYNRLKTRKKRNTITTEEWNTTVAHIAKLKDRAERGELDEHQLKELYDKI